MRFPFLTIIAPAALFCFIYMKITKRKATFNTEAFFEREREANSVRKQPLTDINFVELDMSRIPVVETDNDIINSAYNTLTVLSSKKITNLSSYSNTDLKLKYGVANLPLLTEYDQNYTLLCRTLYDLGKELNSIGKIDSAVSVLEYGIECGTDLKSHYILLADIYELNGRYDKIELLIGSAENINSLLKNSLIKELNNKLIPVDDEIKKILEDISTPDNIS